MKTKILILFVAIAVILSLHPFQAQAYSTPRFQAYTSEWTPIAQDGQAFFIHGLNEFPTDHQILVRYGRLHPVPYESYRDGCIQVTFITETDLSVVNSCDGPVQILVSALLVK